MAGDVKMLRRSSTVAAFLLSIFIVVMTTFCTIHANPVEGTYFSVAPPVYVSKVLGETFTIDATVSNVQNLRAFEFKLGYNTTLLQAVNVVQGTFFPPAPKASIEKLEINETIGLIWVRISLSDSEPTINGSGTLATITFKVTFAPTPPSKACCVLDLHDTFLYDHSMTAIAHDSVGGLYFCRSIQADPPVEGRLLDLYTNKGGLGQESPGGVFTVGEMVKLSAKLTYNDWPVQQKLVVFGVANPENVMILAVVATTDSTGVAATEFRIPALLESAGTWTTIAIGDVADVAVWDSLTFEVTYVTPPHGPKANFTEFPVIPRVNETVRFDASNSLPGWNGIETMPITEYRWDFGDGNESTVSTPIIYHAYKQVEIYYVTLTVYAPGATPETDTTTETKIIYPISLVGGYSAVMNSTTITKPITLYSTIAAISAVAFALSRRKARTKH
jgi:hypothetical protein